MRRYYVTEVSRKHLEQFFAALSISRTEEEVKFAYAKYFDLKYDTSHRHDLYTKHVFFEFKSNKNFHSLKTRASALAQTLYYIRRLKLGGDGDLPVPYQLCMADQNEAMITETELWKDFYDESEAYDWDLAPSTPDARLVDDLASTPALRNMRVFDVQDRTSFAVFAEQLRLRLDPQMLLFGDKKLVTEQNFEDVFKYWNDIFGEAVRNGTKPSRYFVADIHEGYSIYQPAESRVMFNVGSESWIAKKILPREYDHFWSIYDRVSDPEIVRGVLAKIDRLTDDSLRRFYGEFFTPIKFANKALDYIERAVGKEWWKSGEYRLWDMGAGTGNLEYGLPRAAWKYCYLSTYYDGDVQHCRRLFPEAEVFQYDYLNDDVENLFQSLSFGYSWKLPQKLRDDLANPDLKWIVLINPPFATAQKAGLNHGDSKGGVSETKVRTVMHDEGLGEVSRELFAQFIYRIKKEFGSRTTHFGLFSKLKYLNSNNDQKFRDKVFHFGFENGFIFSSANFAGTSKSNQFPVGFLVWDLQNQRKVEEQAIRLDIFNEAVEKVGVKIVRTENRSQFMSKWISRPPATDVMPPLGSAIVVKADNDDRRDRVAAGFLASLMCAGNDPQHQNNTALLSGPYVSAGAFSVTPSNFEESMVVHAVRRVPKADWLNDRDQFMRPNAELSDDFVSNCTVWNLFSNSNQTASLRDVEYEGQIYQIPNHFFPFPVSEVKNWKIGDTQIAETLAGAEDAFVATWLRGRTLLPEAAGVLKKGHQIYRFYFENIAQLPTAKFKIEAWDAGWWQIRKALGDVSLGNELIAEMKVLHGELREKILPEISRYGIL